MFPRLIGGGPVDDPCRFRRLRPGLACLAMAWGMGWARPRYRQASQALRLFAGALILLIPAFVLYPSVHHFADRGLRRLIEEEYAAQARDQRTQLQQKLSNVLQQIDRLDLPNLGQARRQQPMSSNLAFEQVWRHTDLATERLASSTRALRARWRDGLQVCTEPSRLRVGDATLEGTEL